MSFQQLGLMWRRSLDVYIATQGDVTYSIGVYSGEVPKSYILYKTRLGCFGGEPQLLADRRRVAQLMTIAEIDAILELNG